MSVRMALAKLCACTCGGALIGGGAVQIADHPPAQVKVHKAKKKVKARSVAYAPVRKVKRVRKVTRTVTTTCAPATVTVASQGMPMPMQLSLQI
ncbi:MAG: hypothetical protein ACK450_06005 [Sphingomonadales bacterium]